MSRASAPLSPRKPNPLLGQPHARRRCRLAPWRVPSIVEIRLKEMCPRGNVFGAAKNIVESPTISPLTITRHRRHGDSFVYRIFCHYGDGYFGLRHLLVRFVGVDVGCYTTGTGPRWRNVRILTIVGPGTRNIPVLGERGSGWLPTPVKKLPINEADEEDHAQGKLAVPQFLFFVDIFCIPNFQTLNFS